MPGLVLTAVLAAVLGLAAAPGPAGADAEFRRFEEPVGFVRDRDFNRAINRSPIGRSLSTNALGNVVSVQQEGRGNTLILNVEQQNTGAVSAESVLNGSLDLE